MRWQSSEDQPVPSKVLFLGCLNSAGHLRWCLMVDGRTEGHEPLDVPQTLRSPLVADITPDGEVLLEDGAMIVDAYLEHAGPRVDDDLNDDEVDSYQAFCKRNA